MAVNLQFPRVLAAYKTELEVEYGSKKNNILILMGELFKKRLQAPISITEQTCFVVNAL